MYLLADNHPVTPHYSFKGKHWLDDSKTNISIQFSFHLICPVEGDWDYIVLLVIGVASGSTIKPRGGPVISGIGLCEHVLNMLAA